MKIKENPVITGRGNNKVRYQWIFFITGLFSLGWFLLRVIPKPSRATYPCMRAAFPIASGFVLYLISIASSWFAVRKFFMVLKKRNITLVFAALAFVLISLISGIVFIHGDIQANPVNVDSFASNEPFGEAFGIYPGRVVWVWDRFATNKNCSNTVNKNGILDDGDEAWFMDKNTDQMLVTQMVSLGIQELTGKTTDKEAWEAVFKYHNDLRGKGETGYQAGEKILLKLNRTSTNAATNMNANTMARNDQYSRTLLSETSPQIVLAVLRHLVYKAGVPQNAIYVGDPMRNHYQEEQIKYTEEFPEVNYLGTNIYQTSIKIVENGRTPASISNTDLIYYSDNGTDMADGVSDKLYSILEEVDYLINLPMMKGHGTGGITVFPKNHFGSQARITAAHLHAGLVDQRTGYGKYRVQVDIMGSEYLGKKNLLYILDALWAGPDWGDKPVKFEMDPFNDDWTSSVFLSFDPVAIESVAFDFLRTEFNGTNKYTPKAFPNMLGCDDYLHQAASETNWPAGIIYAPDINKEKISSLGVHEHWNNSTEKLYSRNLGKGNGIEMLPLLIENHPPYQVKEFPLFEITTLNEPVTLVNDLNTYFSDYENHSISYSSQVLTDNAIVSITGSTLYVTVTGGTPVSVPVILTASDAEMSFSTMLGIHYAGSVDVSSTKLGVTIFPNPLQDILSVRLKYPAIGLIDARIYDMTGRIVYQKTVPSSMHDHFTLELGRLIKGPYLMEICFSSANHRNVIVKDVLMKE